jgi:hypothetical protein
VLQGNLSEVRGPRFRPADKHDQQLSVARDHIDWSRLLRDIELGFASEGLLARIGTTFPVDGASHLCDEAY